MPLPNGLALEHYIFIAQDGTTMILGNSSTRTILTVEGEGMPPIEYITQRGPMQHGQSPIAEFLQPRLVQMIVRHKFCDRDSYWDGRQDLLNAIRPNRGLNAVLRKVLPDGSKRDLNVAIDRGPNFEPRDVRAWQEWAFQETLRFVAFNPVYFDPTAHTVAWLNPVTEGGFPYTFPFTFSSNDGSPLTFPITFPITFGGYNRPMDVAYAGNWDEYPVFTITGPFTRVLIQNTTTGETLDLLYNVVTGQTVTINLSANGTKSVTLQNGTSIISGLQSNSDLATWHMQPGTNNITVRVWGWSASTSVSMVYYDRYIGI